MSSRTVVQCLTLTYTDGVVEEIQWAAEAIAYIKTCMSDVHSAFPDLRFTVQDWVERDDTIWVRAEGAGTNTGPFAGPPTGLPVRLTVIDIARIADGRIVEHWGVPDRFELLVRLGRIPTRG